MEITITRLDIRRYRYNPYQGHEVKTVHWRAGPLIGSMLQCFPNMQRLDCWNNKLETLSGIESCTQLEVLECGDNHLVSLREIENCSMLKRLSCHGNRLETLEGIEGCPQLQDLICNRNRLRSLEGIEGCLDLRQLSCKYNQIASLDPIVYLRRIKNLVTSGNPLAIQSVQVHRVLDMINGPHDHLSSSIYTDRQNVYNVHIQKSVCDSVRALLTDPKPVFSMRDVIDSDLDAATIEILIEFCSDTAVHSVHLLTYIELLGYVWQRICRSEHTNELLKILAEQVADAECKCFTGRFNLTLSVLVGFYDDICITISDNSRIGAIILAVRARLKSQEGSQIPYNPHTHAVTARRELIEAGYILRQILDRG